MRTSLSALCVTAAAATFLLSLATPAAATAAPPGYRLVASQRVAPGVTHETWTRQDPAQVVHVARIAPSAKAALRVVRAERPAQGPALQRPTAMCARVRCLAAVNGDFFTPSTGEVIGGVVSGGRPVRSPGTRHHQLTFGPAGAMAVGLATWRTTLVSTDLRALAVDGVNVPRGAGRIVLYTPEHGRSTRTNSFGAELIGHVERPRAPLRLGQTVVVRLTGLRVGQGDSPVPSDGVVLSGHGKGAQALRDLWGRIQSRRASARALLRVESDPEALESLGGAPVLVRAGRRYVQTTGPSFITGRHPRTAVGRTATREVLLVTVDGRQPGYSVGMSLPELADLMLALGARDAVNLDGGGSTTFVAGGRVANRPSDRLVRRSGREQVAHLLGPDERVLGHLERTVANILAVVPLTPLPPLADPLAGGLDLGRPVETVPDPASNPHAALPALVFPVPVPDDGPVGLAVTLVLLVGTAAATMAVRDPQSRVVLGHLGRQAVLVAETPRPGGRQRRRGPTSRL